jgi:hypothetical protein
MECYRSLLFNDQVQSCTYKLNSPTYIDARLKILRIDLRTAFKFVRNEYAHNLKQISYEQCCSILDRISRILRVLEMVKNS